MNKKKRDGGFTLLEIIVTIAILAIASAFMATSYTNVMENQRKDADMANLGNVDLALKQVLLYDDAFEEVKELVYDNNKFSVKLIVTNDDVTSESFIELEDSTINDTSDLLKNKCEKTYKYLVELVGEKIVLDANTHKRGYYEIYLTFNGTQVSELRDYVISNDGIVSSNSGDEYLKEYE